MQAVTFDADSGSAVANSSSISSDMCFDLYMDITNEIPSQND